MDLGIDLVQISEFRRRMGKGSLDKVFLPVELSQNSRVESLCGVFAAKEAFFKALGRKDDWLDVCVEKKSDGKPYIFSPLLPISQKAHLSISHTGDYAVAIVLIETLA